MPPDLCCTHPPRPLSPTEPARPTLYNLDGIFAVAALPDDHPHALRLPDRKLGSSLTKGLVRSPSFAAKLKGHWRRKRTFRKGNGDDVRSLRAEVWGYDEDARTIRSEEVRGLDGQGEGLGEVPVLRLRRLSLLSSSPDLRRLEGFSPGPPRKIRSSLEMRRKLEEPPPSHDSAVNLQDLLVIDFGSPPAVVSDLGTHQVDGGIAGPPSSADRPIEPSTSGSLESAVLHAADKVQLEQDARPVSSRSFHLSNMNISKQLRSMSQTSDSMDKTDRLTPEAWTFHPRERSLAGLTSSGDDGDGRLCHALQTSVSGVDNTQVVASWDKLSKDRDASSSVYSRPTSPDFPATRTISNEIADWPLKEDEQVDTVVTAIDGTVEEGIEMHDLAPAHYRPPASQATPSSTTVSVPRSHSATHLAPPERAVSQRSGSSTMTKRSKFLERFTPPSKLVEKRRSMFKFLRPGSRRQQPRSASTPVLRSTPGRIDGASEENEMLTVQYELTQLQAATRSMSLNNLPSIAVSQDDEERGVSTELRPRSSLADYERKLSIMGDDRRRPSAINLRRLSQIQEDDRHDSVGARKSFSRARENDSLMEKALERQLAEKALFRSASRRSGPSTPTEPSAPSFVTTTWGEPTVTTPQSPERDPLDVAVSSTAGKKVSEAHLSPPRTPVGGRSRASTATQPQSGSKQMVHLETPSSASQPSTKSKITSPLSSWTRFPSHNRVERCASAGPDDNVITRDFAFEVKYENAKETVEADCKRTLTGALSKYSKRRLPKSRSATFSTITRNLSSIFSGAEAHAKGRRTSVAVGGRLEYPELEVLPPILPASVRSQPVLRNFGHVNGDVEDGYQKAIHPAYRDQYDDVDDVATESIPFRHASVHHTPGQERSRLFSTVDPTTDVIDSSNDEHNETPLLPDRQHGFPSDSTDSHTYNHNLDGAADPTTSSSPSKAELWSGVYQDCIHRPSSTNLMPENDTAVADAKSMAPPALKPSKSRSLEPQSQHLDPGATVRRFPSVTVVDDRKGHWRSVSFISVQSGKSGMSGASFVRDSSNDLLKLMRTKEQEEKEKLMSGGGEVVVESVAA